MVAILSNARVMRNLPTLGATALGAIAAAIVAALPAETLAAVVEATGLPSLLSAATPPLGATARTLLALTLGGIVGLAFWAIARFVRSRSFERRSADSGAPVLRRADAHPDAPSRRPILASEDLGQPMGVAKARPMSNADATDGGWTLPPPVDPVDGCNLPTDLAVPMAAFDPAAIPDEPAEPVRPVAPLVSALPSVPSFDRIETFELTPTVRATAPAPRSAAPAPTPTPAPSLAALLDRLENGATRRDFVPRRSIDETLGRLRGLATG